MIVIAEIVEMYVLPGEIDESKRKASTDTSWVE